MLDARTQLAGGFATILTPYNVTLIFVAGMIGTIVGALPGLGPSAGIALMLPLAAGMDQAPGLCLLTGVYMGTIYGGRITSILINTPGDAPAIIMALEGYPMRVRGEGGIALGIPGSGGTAIMLGALIMFAMQPGPLLMMQSGDVVWAMIAGLVLANVFLLLSNILLIRLFVNLLRGIQGVLASVVIALCVVGAFSLSYFTFNIWTALVFGVVV